jgi:hypothetical protein
VERERSWSESSERVEGLGIATLYSSRRSSGAEESGERMMR